MTKKTDSKNVSFPVVKDLNPIRSALFSSIGGRLTHAKSHVKETAQAVGNKITRIKDSFTPPPLLGMPATPSSINKVREQFGWNSGKPVASASSGAVNSNSSIDNTTTSTNISETTNLTQILQKAMEKVKSDEILLEVLAPKGIAWRQSPNFDDRVRFPKGPMKGELIKVVKQDATSDPSGVRMALVRTLDGTSQGWLPMTDKEKAPLCLLLTGEEMKESKNFLSSSLSSSNVDAISTNAKTKENKINEDEKSTSLASSIITPRTNSTAVEENNIEILSSNGCTENQLKQKIISMNNIKKGETISLSLFNAECAQIDSHNQKAVENQLKKDDFIDANDNFTELIRFLDQQHFAGDTKVRAEHVRKVIMKEVDSCKSWLSSVQKTEKADEVRRSSFNEDGTSQCRSREFAKRFKNCSAISGKLEVSKEELKAMTVDLRENYFPREPPYWAGWRFDGSFSELLTAMISAMKIQSVPDDTATRMADMVALIASRDQLMEISAKVAILLHEDPLNVTLLNRMDATPVSLRVAGRKITSSINVEKDETTLKMSSEKSENKNKEETVAAVLGSTVTETFRFIHGLPSLQIDMVRSSWVVKVKLTSELVLETVKGTPTIVRHFEAYKIPTPEDDDFSREAKLQRNRVTIEPQSASEIIRKLEAENVRLRSQIERLTLQVNASMESETRHKAELEKQKKEMLAEKHRAVQNVSRQVSVEFQKLEAARRKAMRKKT
eukprot:g3167.t1